MPFGKNLCMLTAGTFCHVLIFLRVDLDTLLGVLQAYVVAFWIQEVSFEIQFLGFSVAVLWGLKYIV